MPVSRPGHGASAADTAGGAAERRSGQPRDQQHERDQCERGVNGDLEPVPGAALTETGEPAHDRDEALHADKLLSVAGPATVLASLRC